MEEKTVTLAASKAAGVRVIPDDPALWNEIAGAITAVRMLAGLSILAWPPEPMPWKKFLLWFMRANRLAGSVGPLGLALRIGLAFSQEDIRRGKLPAYPCRGELYDRFDGWWRHTTCFRGGKLGGLLPELCLEVLKTTTVLDLLACRCLAKSWARAGEQRLELFASQFVKANPGAEGTPVGTIVRWARLVYGDSWYGRRVQLLVGTAIQDPDLSHKAFYYLWRTGHRSPRQREDRPEHTFLRLRLARIVLKARQWLAER
jgi:hypothetical protein